MKKSIGSLFTFAAVAVAGWASQSANEKQLIDYFLLMEPQRPLVSDGNWGAADVLPRDIQNGLEDPTMKTRCY